MSASVLIAGPESIAELLGQISSAVVNAGYKTTITHLPILEQAPEVLREVEALVSIVTPVGSDELTALPNVRAVISPIIGYDWIDVEAANARSVLVANGAASENYESMAEATIMLMLTSLYDLKSAEKQLRDRLPRPRGPMPARMLSGKTVGIIGYGNISRAIIRRLVGWDARIVVSTRAQDAKHEGVTFVELDRLLEESDVVVVMTSLSPESKNLLNAERLGKLKPGCVFINTARGDLVDEAELCRRIQSGHISRAALDVFSEEPLSADNPLRDLPNTILTDHIVGHTREMYEAIPRIVATNVGDVMAGNMPSRTCNSDIVERWTSRWSSEVAAAR